MEYKKYTYRAWYASLVKKYVVAKNSSTSKVFNTKTDISLFLRNQAKTHNKPGASQGLFSLERLNHNTSSINPVVVARLYK